VIYQTKVSTNHEPLLSPLSCEFVVRRGTSQSRFIKWTSLSARRDLPSGAPLQSQRFTASMAVK